jgi:hypothetical protein
MTELVSPTTFKWFVTLVTGIVAGAWFFYDGIRFARLPPNRSGDPEVADKKFGYVMGMVIGLAGIYGCLRFHDVVG